MAETATKMEYSTDKIPRMIKLSLSKSSFVSGLEIGLTYRKMETYCAFQTYTISFFKKTNKTLNI